MFNFLGPLKYGFIRNTISNTVSNTVTNNAEVTKPLSQKIFKSIFTLYTAPFGRGDNISIEKYSGIVQYMNMWYVKISTTTNSKYKKSIYIPTSYIYDKTIEVYEKK